MTRTEDGRFTIEIDVATENELARYAGDTGVDPDLLASTIVLEWLTAVTAED